MRDHSEGWTLDVVHSTDPKSMRRGDIKERFKEIKQQSQVTIDFWISLLELFSVEDIRAIRDGSASRDDRLEPRKATTDFLSFPLATQVPFLIECRSQLGTKPDLLPSHSLEKIASLSKILKI